MYVEYYFLILIFLFILIIGFTSYNYLKYLRREQFLESEISVLLFIVNKISTNYKTLFFDEKYNNLLKKYDTDEKSITNSSNQFRIEYDKLLRESAKEIFTLYFSKDLKKKLFKYFTIDSILLNIISSLRS